jgi:hypothetical protein
MLLFGDVPAVPSPQELSGMLRGMAQLRQGSEQLPDPDDADESDEEEFERALLACTSGRCSGGNSSHLGIMQPPQGLQQQQRQWSVPAEDVLAAAAHSAGGGPAGPQQAGWTGINVVLLRYGRPLPSALPLTGCESDMFNIAGLTAA